MLCNKIKMFSCCSLKISFLFFLFDSILLFFFTSVVGELCGRVWEIVWPVEWMNFLKPFGQTLRCTAVRRKSNLPNPHYILQAQKNNFWIAAQSDHMYFKKKNPANWSGGESRHISQSPKAGEQLHLKIQMWCWLLHSLLSFPAYFSAQVFGSWENEHNISLFCLVT